MLRAELSNALKEAMKGKDGTTVATVRLILAALKDRDIAARDKGNKTGVPDEDILSLMQSMIRQRRDSIELYEKGGRPELAQKENDEIKVIERFLPKQMGEDEMKAAVEAVAKELEATSLKDMGRTMAALRERYAGQMDFAKASGLVKARLS
jgi:uncharacterized protein YqeY